MGKAKLHELLAVEGDLEGTCKKIVEETTSTFKNKAAHFTGWHKRCEMFNEGDPTPPTEQQEMVTTVHKKLKYTFDHIIRYVDAVCQKETTNQQARADVEIDGKVILSDIPATCLLGLESRLKGWRKIIDLAPTLQPGRKWEPDPTKGENVYGDNTPSEVFKTAKVFKSEIIVPAVFPKEGEKGEGLPAQVRAWEEQAPVGKYIVESWSGMITPAEKAKMLNNFDKLLRAIKKARQRANTTEIVKKTIGKEIFDFILS
jgi:hypothetical protein